MDRWGFEPQFMNCPDNFGGPNRARTGHLHIANVALYQMSYGPTKIIENPRFLKICNFRKSGQMRRSTSPRQNWRGKLS